MQDRLDRDFEAKEIRMLAHEDGLSRRLVLYEKAAYLCSNLGTEAGMVQHPSGPSAPLPKLLPEPADDGGDWTPSTRPCIPIRKRTPRVYDAAQKANNARQNLRRGKILKAQTAAKICTSDEPVARPTQAGVQSTIADARAKANVAATGDTRIVGAVADWWSRKRGPPTSDGSSEVGSVKRYRLNCKTTDETQGTTVVSRTDGFGSS
jgi:hypothetical protein